MEQFVRYVVVGGVVLAAGLWSATLAPMGSAAWLLAAGLAAVGCGGVLAGIRMELDVGG